MFGVEEPRVRAVSLGGGVTPRTPPVGLLLGELTGVLCIGFRMCCGKLDA